MDVEKWRSHFQRMAEGKVRPNHKGHYIVEHVQEGGESGKPEIKFVTSVARDIELSKSELKNCKGKFPGREGTCYKRGAPYKAKKTRPIRQRTSPSTERNTDMF